ncbi:probable leucine-rich repeat receptor-like protein kinase [Tanacetum coccineum]
MAKRTSVSLFLLLLYDTRAKNLPFIVKIGGLGIVSFLLLLHDSTPWVMNEYKYLREDFLASKYALYAVCYESKAYTIAISKLTKASVALEKASSPLKLGTLYSGAEPVALRLGVHEVALKLEKQLKDGSRCPVTMARVRRLLEVKPATWLKLLPFPVGICLMSMEEVVDLSVSHETNLSGMELVLYKGDVCAGNSDETEDEPVLVEVSGKELIAAVEVESDEEALEASLGHGERAKVEAVTDLTPGFKSLKRERLHRNHQAKVVNFSDAYCIGTGGYGTVYKAELQPNNIVAVKKLHSSSENDMLAHFSRIFNQRYTKTMK